MAHEEQKPSASFQNTAKLKLENDDKPEPHLPKTQERMKRVQSAFRQCNLKRFEEASMKSMDARSSANMSTFSKFKNPGKVGTNHYMAGRGEPPLP